MFLGQQPYSGFNVPSNPSPQVYAHQIQGNNSFQLYTLRAALLFFVYNGNDESSQWAPGQQAVFEVIKSLRHACVTPLHHL